MSIQLPTLKLRLEAFRGRWKSDAPFTREDFAKAMGIPVGTASATCSYAAREGLLTHSGARPRRYSFPQAAPAAQADIDSLLSIVAEIDAKGIKRTTIAPLLSWAANALLTA